MMSYKLTRAVGQLATGIALWSVAVLMMLPLIWMISASFKYNMEVFKFPIEWIPRHPTLDNYRTLFTGNYNFSRYYANTLYVTFMTVVGTIVVGGMSAYAYAKINFVGRDFIFMFKLAAVAIPFQVVMIPNFIIYKNLGLLDTLTSQWLGAFLGPTMAVFLLRQYFKTLQDEIIDSAKIDGAGHMRTLWTIAMPIARPVLFTVVILYFVAAWNQYESALLFLRSKDNYVVSIAIKIFSTEYANNDSAIMAASVISVIPMLIVLAWGQRHMIEGLSVGAVKG
ncbi:carbohydrate ABC transporter permease [Paenibacillus cymbidii]|uniref:carbohydrate ABC transporter permease n=1 Tax=Paenibacillus cymbidii TaxID=1639034 RepID=UPI0010817515|nr:carbohydrate ABC transporter permease [Paenibacillus cymbidii]